VKKNSDFGFYENTCFLRLYESVFESNLKYRKHLANPFRFFSEKKNRGAEEVDEAEDYEAPGSNPGQEL
jgi:hypothetical protein